jgi:hypothetical protein
MFVAKLPIFQDKELRRLHRNIFRKFHACTDAGGRYYDTSTKKAR